MGKEGVSAAVSTKLTGRRSDGRWRKGTSGNPNGRPSKAQELAMLDAIKSTFPPELVREKLAKALELAEKQNSARGMVAVLEFAANYALGKPVQRVQQEQGGLASVLEELGIDPDE